MPQTVPTKDEEKKVEYIKETTDDSAEEKEPDTDIVERVKNRMAQLDAQRKFQVSQDARRRFDWEWLTRDLYRRGYQFSRYDPSHKTVLISSRTSVKIPINLFWVQMRTIVNQVTSFRPKWETMPKGKSEEAMNNARYSGKLLDNFYDLFNLRKMIKETIIQGLTFSVGGPWQIGYDPDADDGDGEVFVWLLDTFDFFVDPSATSLEEAEFCIKAVRKPLDVIRKNPNYTFYQDPIHLSGESKLAASEYKQFLLQAIKNQVSYDEAQEGAILYECWSKERIGEDNKDEMIKLLEKNDEDAKDLRMGEVIMKVVTYLDFLSDPLKVQYLRRKDFPFELYQADINPVELYGESWAKHVIPANRVLNALESSIFQYNYKYAIGRIVMDKNAGVRIVTNEHGEIVQKNQGTEVSALPLQPLPPSYGEQIKSFRSYIEDLGGSHEVSRGIIPASIKSGVGIAELKAADATNSANLVDNLEDFLVRVGKKILREVAQNYDVPKLIEALGKNGEPEHFMAIGEKFGKKRKDKKMVQVGADQFDIAMIGDKNQMSVHIGSWLAYTKEAQQATLKEYFEAGLIDQQTFLEHTEFSDIQNIVEKTRQEKLLEKYRSTPAGSESQVSDEEIAEQENIMMTQEGRPVDPLPSDNHAVHLIMHQDFADHEMVANHMRQHVEMQKTPQAPQPNQAMQEMGQPMQTPPMLPAQAQGGMMGGGMTQATPPEEQALTEALQSMGMGG